MTTPNRGIPYVPEGTLDPAAGLNEALDVIDAIIIPRVISMALTAPPGGESEGDLYIPASPATGAWAGLENHLVRYRAEGTFWQSYAPEVVSVLLNADDLGLYKWDDSSSPGSWTLAAGLGDAPNDGSLYARRSEAWEAFQQGLAVQNEDSPPLTEAEAVTLVIADGLAMTNPSPGVVRITAVPGAPPAVVDTSDANVDADETNAGNYTRFSHAAPTYTFDDSAPYVIGAEYHGRYVGAGTLTITEAGGMTVNPPADGSLEIPPGGTFTVKIVAPDEADLFGVTVAP